MKTNISETKAENIFRKFYGTNTFIEKSSIPNSYGFKSKNKTDKKGYPDFFKDCKNYAIIVEAKAEDIKLAEEDIIFYMTNNKITKDIIGIAFAGQNKNSIKTSYFYKLHNSNKIINFASKTSLLSIKNIEIEFKKAVYGDDISNEELTSILTNLNNIFHENKIRDTDRSMFFSAIMIALNNLNFRNRYQTIQAPTKEEKATTKIKLLESHYLNKEILDSVDDELKWKINNLSKEFQWKDRFSFIKTVDIPLSQYIEIIKIIETKIYIPFKNNEKQDILGRAYKIFLKRAGKAESKNIILTPDHIKSLMVKLARLDKNDVVLDTCTGSGGFLMESMETLLKLCDGNKKDEQHVREKQLIGFETDPVLFSLACSNMFLHGDGRTNLLFRSSLLNDTTDDKELLNYINRLKPNKIIINPPYEKNSSIKFTKQALDYLQPNGKLIIIMPIPTLTKNVSNGLTDEILKMARLESVIKMPTNLFNEQDRNVNTAIFCFTKTQHKENDEVLFYNLDDDGLVSVQHKGRVDKYNIWSKKESNILNCVFNKKEIKDISEKRKIYNNKICIPYGLKKQSKAKLKNLVKFGDIFDTSETGNLQSENSDPDGDYTFITAAEEWKKHSSYDYDKEAIIYATGSAGSLGRAHYFKGKFIASTLCLVLTPKNNKKYPIDLEFYSYYLMSIRKQLVSDLADGTSKLTISKDALDDYLIEYFDIKKQIKIKKIMRNRIKNIKAKQIKLDNEKNKMFDCIK